MVTKTTQSKKHNHLHPPATTTVSVRVNSCSHVRVRTGSCSMYCMHVSHYACSALINAMSLHASHNIEQHTRCSAPVKPADKYQRGGISSEVWILGFWIFIGDCKKRWPSTAVHETWKTRSHGCILSRRQFSSGRVHGAEGAHYSDYQLEA